MSCLALLNFYWLRESKAVVGNKKRYPPYFYRWDLLKVTARLQAADCQLQTFPPAQGGQSATWESGGAHSLQSSSVGMCPPGLTAVSSCRPSQAPCWVERARMPRGREEPSSSSADSPWPPGVAPVQEDPSPQAATDQSQRAEQTCCKDSDGGSDLGGPCGEPGFSGWSACAAFLPQPKGDTA